MRVVSVLTELFLAPVTGTARRWVFTLNNPEVELGQDQFDDMGARYLVFQEETVAQRHWQGYIEMDRPVRFSHFSTWLAGAHWEKAIGNGQQCTAYCTKEDSRTGGPWIFGELGTGQGRRNDIVALRDAIKSGKRGRELFDDDGVVSPAVKYGRGVEQMVAAYTMPRPRPNVVVTLHYGPAGTGKTHCCHSDDAYFYDGNANGFWNGYKSESKVCLEPFFYYLGLGALF